MKIPPSPAKPRLRPEPRSEYGCAEDADPAGGETNSETTTEEEELAGLSALMAMLPHQQTTTPVATQPASTGEIAPELPSLCASPDGQRPASAA